MSVLIISQHYRPEPNFIAPDVAEHLAANERVTVVTSHPNYPLGRFYPGTAWWKPTLSTEKGVRVCRVPMLPHHGQSVALRLASYMSFVVAAGIAAVVVGGRPRFVWVYHGEFTTGLTALFHKYVLRCPLVITCADLWPESFTASGVVREGLTTALARHFRRWLNRRADLIICATRGTLEVFRTEGIPIHRLAHVPVWVPHPGEPREPTLASGAIVYAGNIGPAQALDVVVEGAARMRAAGLLPEVHFYGTGSELTRLRSLAESLGATNVVFKGPVSSSTAYTACRAAIAQIVCLRSSPLFRFTVPSKISFSFAAGAPILFALEGEARELVASTACGMEFRADAPESFVDAARAAIMLDEAERARIRQTLWRRFADEFDAQTLLKRYDHLLSRIAA